MKEVERQAYVRNPWQQPGNIIFTRFGHSGSREDDAHSHTHVTVMNLSHTGKSWKAIELGQPQGSEHSLDLSRISAVYRDTKMQGYRELGYKVKRSGAEYEIVGVPAEVKAKFSRRHEQVKGLEADYEQRKGAPLTAKAKSRLSVIDRPEKPDDRPIEERRTEWRGRLSDMQLDGLGRLVRQSHVALKRDRYRREADAAYRHYHQEHETHVERGRGYGR